MSATTVTIATTAVITAAHAEAIAEDLLRDATEVADYLVDYVEAAAFIEPTRKGGVAFYTASNRHMTVLQEGTVRHYEAALVVSLREQGMTMNQVVEATGFSKPKARRLLNEWALTAEVEEAVAAADEQDEALVAA